MGIIVFYDGNNGSGSIVQTVDDAPGQDFKPRNDAIKSVKLYGVRPGCTVSLFDSPEGSMKDDFCIVNVRRSTAEYTVDSFQKSYEDDIVTVTYIRDSGSDGEISRIKIK